MANQKRNKKVMKKGGKSRPLPYEKLFFIPDTHIPYHHEGAFKLMLKALSKFRPDVVIILGDFIDCYKVSQHSKNVSRKISMREELTMGRDCIKQITRCCRSARRIYCEGNHEYRLTRYIRDKAPDLADLVEDLPSALDLAQFGWEFIPYLQYVMVGKLMVTHDTGSAGMNAHRKSLQCAGSGNSAVIGHTHRVAFETRTVATGEHVSAAMMGWLGDPEAIDYAHKAKIREWSHGCGVGYKLPDGTVILQPIPFINNHAVVNGKLISLDS